MDPHRSVAHASGSGGAARLSFRQQLSFSEVSGALGDLGTFLPLAVAMASNLGLDLGTTLIFTGCYNVASGFIFGCPICVQPMHTISAIALASLGSPAPLSLCQVMAAGIFVSGVVLLLGVTQLAEVFSWLVPGSVIRGVQLGVGMQVVIKGVEMTFRQKGVEGMVWRQWWGIEGLVLGVAGLTFLLVTTMPPRLDWQPLSRTTVLEPLIKRIFPLPRNSSAARPSHCTGGARGGKDSAEGAATLRTHVCLLNVKTGGDACEEAARCEEAQREDSVERGHGDHVAGVSAGRWQDPELGEEREGVEGSMGGCGGDRAPPCNGEDGRAWGRGWAAGVPSGPYAETAVCNGEMSIRGARGGVEGQGVQEGQEGQVAAACCTKEAGGACSGGSCHARLMPSALVVVLLGLVLAAAADWRGLAQLRLGPSIPVLSVPSLQDFSVGIWRAGLPQLPLTTLNSVLAASELAKQLFPERDPRDFSPSLFALSVGGMNLVGCWFGALPTCHGAGGMAAQFKFGARHGAAPVFLGVMKLCLGLLFGSSLLHLLQSFPHSLLGALLTLAGVELACSARAEKSSRGYTIMLLTAGLSLALDTGMGFVIGWSAAVAVALTAAASGPTDRLCNRLCTWIRTGMLYEPVVTRDGQ